MHKYKMLLADVPLSVNCFFQSTEKFCTDYLYEGETKHEITISEKDIQFEKRMVKFDASDQYLETLAVFRKVAEELINDNVVIFHSSVVEVDNKAFVFAAPSGTGKSTHTRMWREFFIEKRVHMINDDKPLLKIDSNTVIYGTPWQGKGMLGENRSAPVKGICFLKQGKNNEIRRIGKEEAMPKLFRQTYRVPDRKALEKTILLLNELYERIPIYEMNCTISHEAARIAYEYMNGGYENEIKERVCNNI